MEALRVVLDTNLLISYLLTQGKTISRIIDHWEVGEITLLVSPAIVAEIAEVVQRPRLRQHMTIDPQVVLNLISSDALQTSGESILSGVCRDPKDEKFLACAVEGNADYIVTGDNDLLILVQYRGIPIVRPADFVQILDVLQSDEDE